jgi:type IV pilus assembly protein PilM
MNIFIVYTGFYPRQCFTKKNMLWYDIGMDIVLDKNFFHNLKGLLPKKRGVGVVGVDIGSAFIKVVQLHKKNGKAVLDTYGEIALGPLANLEVGQSTNLPVETLVEAIKDLFVEAKVTSRDMVFSLPLSSALISVIEMPDLGPEKLKEMISLEARKYIPIPIAEVSLSHWVIPRLTRTYVDPDKEDAIKGASPKVEVLLVALHNDILSRYSDIATKLDCASAAFEIEIFSSIRSTLGRDSSPIMILDIGAATTKVAIIEEGIVRTSHTISSGSQDVTLALSRARGISILEAEEVKREYGLLENAEDPSIPEITRLSMERILGEASRILLQYQQQKRVSVSKIILLGGGALIKGILPVAEKNFEISVLHGASFEKVESPAVIAPLLKDAGPEFATAIGLALRNL